MRPEIPVVPISQVMEEIGEESVDVTVPPVDATEARQLQTEWKFFDVFYSKEACLAGIHELRMQRRMATGITQ